MNSGKAKKVAYMGVMLALALTLSFFERIMPPLPMLPPGVNLGLSNIITMYCVFFTGAKQAVGIAVLKSGFVALMRGLVAGFLSLCGGLLSMLIIVLLLAVLGHRMSYIATSICGAIAHNIGQLSAASIILSTGIFYYAPVLIVSGIVMGAVTGITLKVLLPVLSRMLGPGRKR